MFCLLWPILAIPFKLVVRVERGALNCDDLAEIRGSRTEREREGEGGNRRWLIALHSTSVNIKRCSAMNNDTLRRCTVSHLMHHTKHNHYIEVQWLNSGQQCLMNTVLPTFLLCEIIMSFLMGLFHNIVWSLKSRIVLLILSIYKQVEIFGLAFCPFYNHTDPSMC